MTKKQSLVKTEEIMPGVKINSDLATKLKERYAEKNQDKILDTIDKINYHHQMVEQLKEELERLTNISI